MSRESSDRIDLVLRTARQYGYAVFGRYRDRADLVAEVQSVAWETYVESKGRGTPRSCAIIAIRTVFAQRQFDQSVRSIDCPVKSRGKRLRPGRAAGFDLSSLWHDGDPARIAGFRLDFSRWLMRLTDRARLVAELLAVGNSTQEVAALLGCTESNVSEYRARLRRSWFKFIADKR